MNPFFSPRPLFCFLSMITLGLSAQSPLQLASDVWPPFTGNADQPRVVIDLVTEALKRANIESETSMVPPATLTEKLFSGEIQGSPALWKTAKREKVLLYSDPILENRLLLVGRVGSDVDIQSFKDLQGKKVGIVDGFGYGPEVMGAGMVLVPGHNQQENLDRLLAKEVDYILVNELLIQYALQHQKADLDKHLHYGDTPLLRRTLHFAVRKDIPHAKKIIGDFNRELKGMMQDGSYQELLQLPWLQMDVDGDGKNELVYHGKKAGPRQPIRRYQPFLSDESGSDAERRYRINGELYPSWDEVPNSLKDTTDTEAKGILYEFKF
ncbi:transporter substrate-binding domain-containing protein [Kiritimatiellaeota bacterium B1221]|nr:transporter substrate-binding domain-containing protein [Kiritimatiellaeota bacterium B1221]